MRNMKVDDLGVPRFTNQDIVNLIYEGNSDKLSKILVEPNRDANLYNKSIKELGFNFLPLKEYQPLSYDKKQFDDALQSQWFMPDKYKDLDIHKWMYAQLQDELDKEQIGDTEEWMRTEAEYIEYEKRGLLNLLRFLIYLVDIMRENNIVWGVGRGSSVASYILYLIGIHKINSIQYGLEYNEFMR